MLEILLVTVIVLAASLYALWRLWPARSRLALLRRLDASQRPGSLVHSLRERAEVASGCGACAGAPAPTEPRR